MDLLAGLPLRTLNLSRSSVKDLSVLSGLPLQTLSLRGVTLGDVSPLAQAPLKSLDLRGCGSLSARFLHGLKVESLWIDNPERHAVFIQSLPKLRYLNDADLYAAEDSPFRRKAPPAPGLAGN
jgi:hypothetical protein